MARKGKQCKRTTEESGARGNIVIACRRRGDREKTRLESSNGWARPRTSPEKKGTRPFEERSQRPIVTAERTARKTIEGKAESRYPSAASGHIHVVYIHERL